MRELLELVITHLLGMWRYRWYAMVSVWLIVIAGWTVIWHMPDRYSSNAKVEVDTESMLRPLLVGLTVETDIHHRLQMLTRTMLTRPNLERLVQMADLDTAGKSAGEIDSLLGSISRRIQINTTREQNFYTISFEDKDPAVAQRVVNALLTIFVDNTLGDKRTDSTAAQRFLDQQIMEYESRLLAAEERLQEFRKANAQYMTGTGQTYFQRLEAAQIQLKEARLQLEEEERRRDEISRQLSGERPAFGFGTPVDIPGGGMPTPLDTRIQLLYSRLDELLLQYTDNHPDVRAVRETLAALEKLKAEELAARAALPAATALPDQNPVFQQMRISLAQAEATAASLQVRVREYEQRVDNLNRMVNTIPEVEAQLQRLDRDYDIHKQNYEALVTRRETAKITDEAAQSGDSIKLKVVDPPRVPLSPSGPDRVMFSSAVVVTALGIGFGIAFLLSQLWPVFFDRRSLRQVTGLPVLGGISRVWTNEQISDRRRRLTVFSASLFVLVICYGGLIAVYTLQPAGFGPGA